MACGPMQFSSNHEKKLPKEAPGRMMDAMREFEWGRPLKILTEVDTAMRGKSTTRCVESRVECSHYGSLMCIQKCPKRFRQLPTLDNENPT